ncbi:MAG: hypothetical protein ACE5FV_03230 [Woeseia sp.]
MRRIDNRDPVSASEVRIALNEIFPESSYGAVPVTDQFDAVEAFRAYDDGGLAEVPNAHAAYLQNQRRQSL